MGTVQNHLGPAHLASVQLVSTVNGKEIAHYLRGHGCTNPNYCDLAVGCACAISAAFCCIALPAHP